MAAKKPTKQQIAQAKARAGGNTTSKTTPARMAKGAKDIALFAATIAGPGKIIKGASTAGKAVVKTAASKPAKSMTSTVIKKVSNDVKVLKPGSRPLTQSATEKAAVKAKAATKTPKKRAAAKNIAAQAKQEKRFNRNLYLNDVYKKGLSDAGYNLKGPFNSTPTAAQTKAANKARDAAAFALKWNKKLK